MSAITKRIALQIYTVRAAGDLAARLTLAREAGYAWVETEAMHGMEAPAFVATLRESGLGLASMHVEMSDLAARLPAILSAMKELGCKQLVMPWLEEHERPADAAGWQALAMLLQAHAQRLADEGIGLAYHNHAFEFERLDDGKGRTVLETLFDAAPSLRWQPDVAWVARAGEDPTTWLARYAARLQSVHVKDLNEAGDPAEQGWATLGEGRLPWAQWLPGLQSRIQTFIVEHDHPREPARTARVGLAFLRQRLA